MLRFQNGWYGSYITHTSKTFVCRDRDLADQVSASYLTRYFAKKGVARTVSLPIFSVFFRFLPFSPFSSGFFPFPFLSFFCCFFSGSDFLPFFPFSSVFFSVFFRFIFRRKRGDTVRETPFAKPRLTYLSECCIGIKPFCLPIARRVGDACLSGKKFLRCNRTVGNRPGRFWECSGYLRGVSEVSCCPLSWPLTRYRRQDVTKRANKACPLRDPLGHPSQTAIFL